MKTKIPKHRDIILLPNNTGYKYLQCHTDKITKKITYSTNIGGLTRCMYDNPKEAAIAVDKYLISKGKEPINVLKRTNSKSLKLS